MCWGQYNVVTFSWEQGNHFPSFMLFLGSTNASRGASLEAVIAVIASNTKCSVNLVNIPHVLLLNEMITLSKCIVAIAVIS